MARVQIIRGSYRNQTVENVEFTLARPIDSNKPGKIQVKNEGQIPDAGRQIYIDVRSSADFTVLDSGRSTRPTESIVAFSAEPEIKETDEEAMDRIRNRFRILDTMTKATINGDCRAMIVTGPPGVGKSHGVETQLERSSLFDKLAGKRVRYEIIKGAMTAIGLYALLYKYSDRKNVLVFDDCDVWDDQDALNILKAALDSGKRRRIWWNSDSSYLRKEGIPNSFDFNGACIFITNLDFGDRRSKKIQAHLEALQSRCHYLDLTINTQRDKILRIRQVHLDAAQDVVGGMFADYGFEGNQAEEVLAFMQENANRLREVSIRMALKVADLIKIEPNDWRNIAQHTVMR